MSRGSWVRTVLVFCVSILVLIAPAFSQPAPTSVPHALAGEDAVARAAPSLPLGLAAALRLAPAARLAAAEVGAQDELQVLRAWNREGRLPLRNGFRRALPSRGVERLDRLPDTGAAVALRAGSALASGGRVRYASTIEVEAAHRLRLRLERVVLPAGTELWVYSDAGETVAFGLELLDAQGGQWTPSVEGPRLHLELLLPAPAQPAAAPAAAQFEATEVLELFPLDAGLGAVTQRDESCLVDAQCVSAGTFAPIALVKRAIGQLQFDGFVCTGALLNDTLNSLTPYLLTANHCFDSQSSASGLEVFWDYLSPACNNTNWPSLSSLPRSNGSTLLTTGASSDYTLVRLNSVPGGRSFLGWDTAPVVHNQILHRLSHPLPDDDIYPQAYTQYRVDTTVAACQGLPRPQFIYTKNIQGGTFGGSSGSALLNANGQVVGDLNGACGPDPADGCNFANADTDGAFAQSFPALQPFLAPAVSGPCAPNTTTLCIDRLPGDLRFKVTMQIDTVLGGGIHKPASSIPLGALGITKGGILYFNNPANPEVLIKVLDGCPANNNFWVFYAATTTAGFTITVTDTKTGQVRTYTNPDQMPATTITDTGGFATCSTP